MSDFSSNSSQVSSNVLSGIFLFPNRVFFKPYYVKTTNIQTYHRLKLPLPSNFLISNFVVELEAITRRLRKTPSFNTILLWAYVETITQ
ncbi:hypothetical protein BT93_L1860 [Corymbia citriodora subsp. variegata]|uniref:Uncharacterized protein n=1 Tax=Corymbia citriodora subsp. variegata TaxID=360336 RepID=A0A8T0CLH1_CORYI|nr:hypothetical protein BT93_L1860 [Corymbia citriodora subsp. variegata]